jgi:hypothetical protein
VKAASGSETGLLRRHNRALAPSGGGGRREGPKITARRYTNEEDGKFLRSYWTTACLGCPLKDKCTTGKERRVKRWEHEAVVEAAQNRLETQT